MWLLVAFIAVPLIEIALFIQVGGAIGLWPTLLIVILTALLGTSLLRNQGALALNNLRNSFNDLRDPTEPLAHGAMILFSGALLLTPGFFTDTMGFLLLVPAVRHALFNYVRARVKVQTFSTQPQDPRNHSAPDDIIEAEYHEVDEDKRPTHPNSGWTKH
ncbi:FxsA family protein [Lentibacter sp. XHP0401]|uniref:FxsA family protein n=1 Tax=Lentibacter sp. XHP0401 TaxID=2984334 RepID=UPI0021E945CB|nr:FxsA family protein [Lentibacter sp. XHP0401]MCV2892604.1 FxsA family protein [Lentibacter sp. XHP0401]